MRWIAILLGPITLSSCSDAEKEPRQSIASFDEQLAELYATKPQGSSRAYAVVKNGIAVPAWLATIHGYVDNRAVCEQLIAAYNEDASMSVLAGDYTCRRLGRFEDDR